MATLTVLKPASTGVAMGAGTAATAAGDVFPNDGQTILRFTNTSSQITVTVASHEECSQGGTHNLTFVVPATTGDYLTCAFEKTRFDNESEQVEITYSAVTGVTVWAISSGGAQE